MRGRTVLATSAVAAIISGGAFAVPAEATSPVRISAVQYDSPGSDTGSNSSLNAEWVKITNYGATAKALTGWTLRDTSNHVYRFGTYRLGAGRSVRVHTGRGSNSSTDRYMGRGWYVWNNTHDKAILKNASGVTVATKSW